jgi:hypothetical protein
VTPKTKNATLKKKPGRPSGQKTTLAVLRSMLRVNKTTKIWLKRKGQYKVERVTLPVSTVAKWLNVSDDTVRCIERGRTGYPLTEAKAEMLAYQTGASREWILAGDVSKPVVKLHWVNGSRRKPYGEGRYKRYTQKDFDDRRKVLSRSDDSGDLEHARMTVAFSCAKIAAILVRGFERGKAVEYALKLNQALRSVYFDKDERTAVWPGGFEPAADYSSERFDITPTLRVLENRVREIQREKKGKVCPACLGQGCIACPNCIVPVATLVSFSPLNKKRRKPAVVVKGKVIEQLLIDEETGKPVNCEVCKNDRIIKCRTCDRTPTGMPSASFGSENQNVPAPLVRQEKGRVVTPALAG